MAKFGSKETPEQIAEQRIRKAAKEKYPFIRAFVETDCEPDPDGFGIDTLKEKIGQIVAGMPGVRDTFPASWWKIKERLGKMKHELNTQYLSFGDYCHPSRNLCLKMA